MKNFKPILPILLLTVATFFLTKNPLTGSLKLYMALVALLFFVTYSITQRKKDNADIRKFTYVLITFVLFLVAATGWFFSPFFFTLYLLGIILAFVFSNSVSTAFIITLVALFSFSIGEVDIVYDFLVVLSLLTVIPLSIYLRREYLKIRENQKDILILNKEEVVTDKLQKVLSNKVTNFAATLRQPLNDIKQLTAHLSRVKEKQNVKKVTERILISSQEALGLLKEFEENTTGKKLLRTPSDRHELRSFS
ncbi:MAG: hypothetical protein HYW33_03665 [Candidatus Blackburnbacteria bacterium]|nr:hypothetical protein [Candidatus Blackburnbacteria bacterium]